jgi:type II secretory pathway pseudopilin PulG
MSRVRRQQGLSLVEVTIILLVLMLLAGVLAPSIFDFVNDARWVKVKEDCEAIGVSIARLMRDVGPCARFDGQSLPCTQLNTVPLLVSSGRRPTLGSQAATAYINGVNTALVNNNWNEATRVDTLENHLVFNTPSNSTLFSYPTVSQLGNFNLVGPQFNLGWRGAYLAAPIGPDPWGSTYMVNSLFLAPPSNPTGTSTQEGTLGWDRDVFCISPGPNVVVETFFGGCLPNAHVLLPMGTCRQGDDFVYIIQGSTR